MVYTAIKTPGVYVNEVSIFPPSVAQVPTAIPAFIGYTEYARENNGESLLMKSKKISSMMEFEFYFGLGPKLIFNISTGNGIELDVNNKVVKSEGTQGFYLYNSMQLFFSNGGGDCYIIAIGKYTDTISYGTTISGLRGGLEVLSEIDEPTMILFPDAVSLIPQSDFYTLQTDALEQCGKLMDRVGVFDILRANDKGDLLQKVKDFRDNIGMNNLKYGGAYAPWLKVSIKKDAHYRDIKNKIVKTGSTFIIDLKNLVNGYSVSDTNSLRNLITELDQITSDNDVISDTIKDALSAANNNSIIPTTTPPFAGDLPSIEIAFDMVVQSVGTKIAEAEAETDPPTKLTKITAAGTELQILLLQIYNLIRFIDDFGFLDGLFMSNKEIVENTYKAIGLTGTFPPPPPILAFAVLANPFKSKLQEVLDWNLIISTVVIADPVVPPQTLGIGFETFTLPVGAVNPLVLSLPGPAPLPLNAGDSDRITNIKYTVTKFKELFKFFNDIVTGIQVFGQTLENVKEDALLKSWPVYKNIIESINNNLSILPPSGAIAGVYARVDNDRGVWKAPANVSVNHAKGTLVNITDNIQDGLNVDVDAGKSVNAIRVFSGKGTMVWGARTLAGNDNEWRYISVRRFFNMVEESVKKSTSWAVFEPNDANTWLKVKSMIENFLTLLWRQGALAGAKPEEAFFVHVGLNKTMTYIDILEGRMIVKIGMAAVRPAEFIILEFSHMVQTS